jgi:hypothetical protein
VAGRGYKESCRRVNLVEILILMDENGKMGPIETIPGIRGGREKENDGRGEFSYNILKELL